MENFEINFLFFYKDNSVECFPYGEADFLKIFFRQVGVKIFSAVIASNKSMKKLLEK